MMFIGFDCMRYRVCFHIIIVVCITMADVHFEKEVLGNIHKKKLVSL